MTEERHKALRRNTLAQGDQGSKWQSWPLTQAAGLRSYSSRSQVLVMAFSTLASWVREEGNQGQCGPEWLLRKTLRARGDIARHIHNEGPA